MREEHPLKALLSIEVTEFGIVSDVKPEQPEEAYEPIEVTEYDLPLCSIDGGIIRSVIDVLAKPVTVAVDVPKEYFIPSIVTSQYPLSDINIITKKNKILLMFNVDRFRNINIKIT